MQVRQAVKKILDCQIAEDALRQCLRTAHAAEPSVPQRLWNKRKQLAAFICTCVRINKDVALYFIWKKDRRATIISMRPLEDARHVRILATLIVPKTANPF